MKKRYLFLVLILVLFISSCDKIKDSPSKIQDVEKDMDILLFKGMIEKKTIEINKENILENSVFYEGIVPKGGCIQLSQSDFDEFNSDVVFGNEGECVELIENINFDHSIIIKGDGFYLDCNNNKVTGIYSYEEGYAGIIGTESSVIRKCVVEKRFYNFLLMDSSEVYDSKAVGFFVHDGGWYATTGFELRDFSKAYRIIAENNGGGFALETYPEVYNGTAINNSQGFVAFGNSKVFDSLAKENRVGYVLRHDASINNSVAEDNVYTGFDFSVLGISVVSNSIASGNPIGFSVGEENRIYSSLAENNNVGFSVYGNALVFGSVAVDNSNVGFSLGENANVSNCASEGNGAGYSLMGDSFVEDSIASGNSFSGFSANGNSVIRDSISSGNGHYGFSMSQYSSVFDSVSENNSKSGFFLCSFYGDHDQNVENVKARYNQEEGINACYGEISGGEFCFNEGSDILSDGATFNGNIKTNGMDGEYSGNPTIRPCVKDLEGQEFAESF